MMKKMIDVSNTLLPKVSIIIPVYNGANYMRIAIDSAINQTYSNTEIIVVDDGSIDNTAAIATSYGDKIRYFKKANGGCGSALNFGISKMTGEYFSWLSHDDVYSPQKVELQVKSHLEVPDKNTVIYSGWETIDADSRHVYAVSINRSIPQEKYDVPLYAFLRGLINGCALLIPAVHFSKIGLFDESLRHTQDYDFFFKLFRQAPQHFCNHVLVSHRLHPSQDSFRDDNAKSNRRREECNQLWSMFLDSLTEAEMAQVDETPYAFYRRMAVLLSKTDYDAACLYAHSLAEKRLRDTLISIVLPFFNNIVGALQAIDSLMIQTHQNFELIVVNNGSTVNTNRISEKISSDPRVKYLVISNQDYETALATGAKIATGRYLVHFSTNQILSPETLATHLRCKEDCLLRDNHQLSQQN